MFEFMGNGSASKDAVWTLIDHDNIQDLGRRPFTTMVLPTVSHRTKTEGAGRPSPPLRSRSNSFAPTYSRPQGTDDLAPVATSIYRPTPRLHVERRSLLGGSTHSKGDGLDIFTPKALLAKGSKLLKRENSKRELTSLSTLDGAERSQEARARHLIGPPPPPELRRSRLRSTGDSTAATQLQISEPFNFHHITHTQRHHVQNLDTVNSQELVSGFSAIRASQAPQPALRGINVKDIQREDSPRDALLPDLPSQPPNHHTALPPSPASTSQDFAPDGAYGATSPTRVLEYSRLTDNFSHPDTGYHNAQTSPISPSSRASSHNLTPDFFTFHDELLPDTTLELPLPTESPEPLDYSIASWDDRMHDFASPHAVTTDDGAEFIRHGPFSMVKTELAPVEEDDEDEEEELILASGERIVLSPRRKNSDPRAKNYRPWRPHTSTQGTGDPQWQSPHSKPPPRASPRVWTISPEEAGFSSLHERGTPPTRAPGPFIEDPIDDIPIRSRFSRCISVDPNDMDGFWDMASDAISCSYALGAEGDSNFDWDRLSDHEDDTAASTAEEIQPNPADMQSGSSDKKPRPESPSLSRNGTRRSSSVYSSSSSQILPLQTSVPQLEPPSASSTDSSFSSFRGTSPRTETGMTIRFPTMNGKEWCQPAYIVPNDLEPQAVQEHLYQHMYAGDYSEEAQFQIPNVGRVDGSTMTNSPRSSRSPISKSSSQESFWVSQSAINTRQPRNAGSIGSLPELIPSKNSRERFDFIADKYAENTISSDPSESPSDSQETLVAQRRRSPNLAKDAAQNVILSKVRTVEQPVPSLRASRDRAISDVTCPSQDPSVALPAQPTPGGRMRSKSSASNIGTRSSRSSLIPAPLAPFARRP